VNEGSVAPAAAAFDLRDSQIALFAGMWRLARERLRQQDETLSILFAAAADAATSHPGFPKLDPESMSVEDWDAFRNFFEQSGKATGTRDAYSTALTMVIDDVLKMTRQFYDRIPDAPMAFGVRVNGKDLFDIFRAVGNNVRHHQEWLAPTDQIPKAKQAYWAVETIAIVVGREVPPFDGLSVMASNWSWPVLHAIGNGTYDGLLVKIRQCMDELIRNVGRENDPSVLAEVARQRVIANTSP
jgi:hypothetical protein